METHETSLTLYPSKRKALLWLFVSALFTVGGIWRAQYGEWMGWVMGIFFGIGCVIFIIELLLPNASYLRLSEQGFQVRTLFFDDVTHWDAVERFSVGDIESNSMVTVHYAREHKGQEYGRAIAEKLTGAEGALPSTYGKSAEELAQLLNTWKERFTSDGE